ncbi:MAG: sulfotransferase [Promethearchaeota archaeon]
MSVIVIGVGRSGTNMALEILAFSKELRVSDELITKKLFQRKKWPKNYLTKGPDTQDFEYSQLKKLMKNDKHMKIIWTIRDPRDIIISKMRRGMPNIQGGDSNRYIFDATPEGSTNNVFKMFELYKKLIKDFPNRVFLLKMEEVISNFESTIMKVCEFLKIKYNEQMKFFYKRMRNKKKRERYNKIDKGELAKWTNWQSIYNGFFIKEKINLPQIFEKLEPIIDYFNY